MQNPDNQIVTDKVWHEMSFGLENLGTENSSIRLKTAEMADYFGIAEWFNKDVYTLSGGQKQLLNLASVMVMAPELLILDEPVSQLDPVSASDFLSTIGKLNRDLGLTILITEHRLEEIFPCADRIVVMDKGKIISDCAPNETGKKLDNNLEFIKYAMPAPMRIYAETGDYSSDCPINIKEGRQWLENINANGEYRRIQRPNRDKGDNAIEIKNLFFRYEKKDNNVIDTLSASFERGKITAVLGGNGTGKSTLLKLIAGILKPVSGKIKNNDLKIAYLPQQVKAVFTEKTVKEDLMRINKNIDETVKLTDIENVLDNHPFDLSGGEMQRAATAKILLTNPDVILLDEPTKGMDGEFKITFGNILKSLASEGKTVIMVSHDTEFCAVHADICMMLFGGKIVADKDTGEFFSDNIFYTTAAHRMSRNIFENAVTDAEVAYLCKKNLKK